MTDNPTPNDIALLREAYIRDIGKILRPSDVTVARAAFDAGFAAALTPTKHDDATAEREASAGAIAAFNDAFDAYAQHMCDPDGRDDIHAATNAAALVIDAFAKPAPSEQAMPRNKLAVLIEAAVGDLIVWPDGINNETTLRELLASSVAADADLLSRASAAAAELVSGLPRPREDSSND